MTLFLFNVLLMVAWGAVTGSFSVPNLLLGFLLGTFALSLIREQVGGTGYVSRMARIAILAILFLRELALSAWTVAKLVLAPRMDVKPGIFAYPLKVDRDVEITLLANLITLTPGTLSVDVSHDRRVLYVHAIDCSDVEGTKASIASGFERRILEALR